MSPEFTPEEVKNLAQLLAKISWQKNEPLPEFLHSIDIGLDNFTSKILAAKIEAHLDKCLGCNGSGLLNEGKGFEHECFVCDGSGKYEKDSISGY